MKRHIAYGLVVAAGLTIAVAPALAGKGGNGGGNGGGKAGTADPSISPNGPAAYETGLTFTTLYPNSVNSPRVQVMCYQNGTMVYGEAGTPDHTFLLGGAWSPWVANGGGPASCHADLLDMSNSGNTVLASTDFPASG